MRKMSRTSRILVPASVAVAFCVLSTGCKQPQADAAPEPELKRPVVLTEPVRRADLTETLVYPVDLEPETEVSVNALMSERIVKFPWNNGDRIKKGEVVAKIRADNASQVLVQMRAEIESLDAQIDSQKRELSRSEKLLAQKVITQQSFDQLQSSLLVSDAKRKSLQAGLSQSAINAGHATIKAPIGGIIANKRVNEGDLAAPQLPLCTIMTEDPVKVVLKLTEKDAALVHPNQPVRIELDAYPGRRFEGNISKILPYLDPATRTNEVTILLDNPADTDGARVLKPGMFGRAFITAEESKNTLAVPEKALVVFESADKQETTAFVVDKDEIAHKRIVRTGIREGDRIEILEGLKEGDQVVVRGQYGLSDGRPVTLFDPQAAGGEKESNR